MFEALLATIAVAGSLCRQVFGFNGEKARSVIHFYSVFVSSSPFFCSLSFRKVSETADPEQFNGILGTFGEAALDVESLTNLRLWLVALCIGRISIFGRRILIWSFSNSVWPRCRTVVLNYCAVVDAPEAMLTGFIDRFHPVRPWALPMLAAYHCWVYWYCPLILPSFFCGSNLVICRFVEFIGHRSVPLVLNLTVVLAIGMVSMIGYAPDFMPMLYTYLIDTYGDNVGYKLYFGGAGLTAFFGTACAFYLLHLSQNDDE